MGKEKRRSAREKKKWREAGGVNILIVCGSYKQNRKDNDMTISKTNLSSKKIQNYLSEKGLARNQKGFFYLTCYLAEYLESPGPLVLQEFYDSLHKQGILKCGYNDTYQRCLYTIRQSLNEDIKNMGVKDFLCLAYDELTHLEEQ